MAQNKSWIFQLLQLPETSPQTMKIYYKRMLLFKIKKILTWIYKYNVRKISSYKTATMIPMIVLEEKANYAPYKTLLQAKIHLSLNHSLTRHVKKIVILIMSMSLNHQITIVLTIQKAKTITNHIHILRISLLKSISNAVEKRKKRVIVIVIIMIDLKYTLRVNLEGHSL